MKRVSRIAAVILLALSIAVWAIAQTSAAGSLILKPAHSAASQHSTGTKSCPGMESANQSVQADAKPIVASGCPGMESMNGSAPADADLAGCCQEQIGAGGCCKGPMGHNVAAANSEKFNAELDTLVADMNKAPKGKKLDAITAVINRLVEERRAALSSSHDMAIGANNKRAGMCAGCSHCPMMTGAAAKNAPKAAN